MWNRTIWVRVSYFTLGSACFLKRGKIIFPLIEQFLVFLCMSILNIMHLCFVHYFANGNKVMVLQLLVIYCGVEYIKLNWKAIIFWEKLSCASYFMKVLVVFDSFHACLLVYVLVVDSLSLTLSTSWNWVVVDGVATSWQLWFLYWIILDIKGKF